MKKQFIFIIEKDKIPILGIMGTLITGTILLGYYLPTLIGYSSILTGSFFMGYVLGTNHNKKLLEYKNDKNNSVGINNKLIEQLEDKATKEILFEYINIEGYSEVAKKSASQYAKLQEKYQCFKELLSSRFKAEEITYIKFISTVEQVYLGLMENFDRVKDLLKASGGINIEDIENRMNELNRKEKLTEIEYEELASLKYQKANYNKTISKITEFISLNEIVFVDIDRIIMEIASIKTTKGKAEVKLEVSRNELEQLIERVKEYDIENFL